jgi:hypothetical protein
MQVTAEEEMAELVRSCLPELNGVEAVFVRDCWLREPTMPLAAFAKQRRLSAKALSEVRERALVQLKGVMARKGINSLADIV